MGQNTHPKADEASERTHSLLAPSTAVDPALASLFASSAGPVQFPRAQPKDLLSYEAAPHAQGTESEGGESSSDTDLIADSSSSAGDSESQVDIERPRKRRRVEADDLEASYFQRLAREEEREERQRRLQQPEPQDVGTDKSLDASSEDSHHAEDPIPVHEALTQDRDIDDKNKLERTVFLSNVSITAITSKSYRKQLLKHLGSALKSGEDDVDPDKVESVRFRSTAYASRSGPKKAAFATKDLKEQTTKSTNAYVVFSSRAAAQRVASKLNGTMILDRHIRIDHLADPSSIDHKRCVFVGNLNFVDEEMAEDQAQDGESKTRRPKARQPADAEEGLWRTFSKVGKVENVRVVRDKHSRVGKGFAYVQFADQNGVEAALLLNEKKFPPMLPRKLRVMRAKKAREKSSHSSSKMSGPGSRKSGSKFDKTIQRSPGGLKRFDRSNANLTSTKFVFEGHRVSMTSLKDEKQKKKKRSTQSTSRSAKRGAAFKAAGGKKQRDRKP